ncbi:unnamed protein product [Amoebophrya sp. A120]|nr:unnamed protein product [Amoebophrya sp. A120]|eukprot:GSA120T00023899001.1
MPTVLVLGEKNCVDFLRIFPFRCAPVIVLAARFTFTFTQFFGLQLRCSATLVSMLYSLVRGYTLLVLYFMSQSLSFVLYYWTAFISTYPPRSRRSIVGAAV